tara:strand:- start:2296 stop:5202 length:2907 start_codon:yes stop_codon:yes gene_type:complete
LSLSPSNNYTGASYLGNVKENWLFQLFNQDSYLSLDGSDDYVNLGSTSGSSPLSFTSTTKMSACGWIKFSTLNNIEYIFANNSIENWAGVVILKDGDNKLGLLWGDTSGTNNTDYELMRTDGTFSANTWTFFAITTDFSLTASNTKIWLGTGSTLTAQTISNSGSASITTPTYTSGNAYIGRYFSTYSELDIRNLGFWTGELDSDNVTALFNSGNFLSFEEDSGNYNQSSNLKGYFEFNNGENFAQDLTGNVTTGTITGAKYKGFLPLSYRDTKVDNVFYHGVVKSSASIRNSIDVLKSTEKIGNLSLSIINSKYQGSDLSKELFLGSNNYYNRTIKVYSQLNEINDISECLQLYHGRLTSISHNDSDIKLSIVQKSPWDNITIPNVKSERGNFFPVVYGNYIKNTSTYASTAYVGTLKRQAFPVKVDSINYYYNCLLHKDIGSTDTMLHYYEESMDAFLPLEDSHNAFALGDGYALKTSWKLKRHIKFKPLGVIARSLGANFTNIIDGDVNHALSDGQSSIDMAKASDGASTNIHKDNLFTLPLLSDLPDIISTSNNHGLKVEVTWNMTGVSGATTNTNGLTVNSITIYDQSRYATGSIPNSTSDGTQFATNGTFNGSLTSGTSTTISEVTSATTGSVTANSYHTYPWDNGMSIRFKRVVTSATDGAGGFSSTIDGTLNVADVRLTGTFRIHDYASRVNEIKELYCGADGLTASWDSGAITLGYEAHRDLLIRYAGMPTIEPENWSALESDRNTWAIRYWLHDEKDLKKILEKLQYEFGIIASISPSGVLKYKWIHGTGTNNAFRAEDVVATLNKADISNTEIKTTSLKDVVTKTIINYRKHPAKDSYINRVTALNADPRSKYNIKSKENIATVNLDALTFAPATTPATNKQADFYSYYSQVNSDVKKIVDCEIVNIQKGYLLETGDIIKFDDMVVEPFGSDWSNYYMIVSISRSAGKIKITAREVG